MYPGSFDPVTFGHLDVVARATDVFERVVVALLVNTKKSPLWPTEERLACLREAVDAALDGGAAARVEIVAFDGLTVDAARRVDARFIVRGLRAVSDFESEMQMAHTNRKLAPEVDTVFFMTALEHAYLSSSLVREISLLGGDVAGMVPPAVMTRLRAMPGVG
ncbi:MAG TPA: pantetheine-phosphate adenylyltransferase [Candidatus Saccharimonadia bacterium]|nr:pantetheine-phosphate adenylyltransferase [Candidatus Saccharimonadia bacterium]